MLRGRLLALTLVLLAVVGGCARLQALGGPVPAPSEPVPSEPAPSPPAPSPPAPSAPAPAKPASPKPALPPPVISPLLSPPVEERLRRDATARIDNAERIVKQVADRRLGADQQETLSTIQSFLIKARQALSTQDLQQAFNLADKADALARELIRTTR